MKEKEITFRTPRSLWVVVFATTAVFLSFTIIAFKVDLDWWYRLAYLGLCALCPVALLELQTQRVLLERNSLVIVKNFRRRVFPREDVEAVTWGKGAGVSVRLSSGEWIRFPPVGTGSNLSVVNTVRAWIKRTKRA